MSIEAIAAGSGNRPPSPPPPLPPYIPGSLEPSETMALVAEQRERERGNEARNFPDYSKLALVELFDHFCCRWTTSLTCTRSITIRQEFFLHIYFPICETNNFFFNGSTLPRATTTASGRATARLSAIKAEALTTLMFGSISAAGLAATRPTSPPPRWATGSSRQRTQSSYSSSYCCGYTRSGSCSGETY